MVRSDSFTFDGSDGAKIFTYRWLPSRAGTRVLQSRMHGEHACAIANLCSP